MEGRRSRPVLGARMAPWSQERGLEALKIISLEGFHGVRLLGVRHHERAAGTTAQAVGLEHVRLVRVAGDQVDEHAHQPRALHVALDRLGRLPRDDRQAEERGRPKQAAAQARDHLLLARRAVEVVLAGGAVVLAHPGEAQRRPPVEPVLALAQLEALVEVVERGEQIFDLLFTVTPPMASIRSGKSWKSTSTTWLIFRSLPRKPSTVLIISEVPPSA